MTTHVADLGAGGPTTRPTGRRLALRQALAALVGRVRNSEYLVVGDSQRFRAVQRRRTMSASRIGYVVIVVGALFDTVALLGLETASAEIALGLSIVTGAVAIAAWILLPGRLRRHPEPSRGS